MMRKTLLATLLLCSSLSAAPAVDQGALRDYARRALARCPDAVVTLTPFNQSGPANFYVFDVRLDSSDEGCRTRKQLLYSPTTQQIVLGVLFVLPQDNRPVQVRVADHAAELLKSRVGTTVSAFPLPDGLKSVSIIRETQYGPFAYHGYVDASEQFLIVGSRGNLRTDPGQTLREALGMERAARRGNPKARVEIIELSDFECPTCGKAHKMIEPMIARNLSKINYARLDLPLFERHEWSIPAALAARAIQKAAPSKYWTYVDFVFQNQETIGKMAFDQVLKNFCEDHDISWTQIEKTYRSSSERLALLDQVSRAFDNGINATPTFIINGQVSGFGPDGAFAVKAIKQAIGGR